MATYPTCILILSHQHISTSTHQHISTSAHQHISTSAHQHISISAYQHINTSAHQHISTSTYLYPMLRRLILSSASLLFRFAYPMYRPLYFWYKSRKDKPELELLGKIIPGDSVILDIGANIGFYSCFLAELTGKKGHVYAFEPDAVNFSRLKKQVSDKSNVTPVQKAIAANTGKTTLYTSSLLNVDHRTYRPEHFRSGFEVEKTSVDDFINGKVLVGFIKMDIQGFEMEALKGMQRTLESNPDILVLMEFWPYGLRQAGSSTDEVFDFVTSLGFGVYKVTRYGLLRMTESDAREMKVDYFTDINVLLSRKDPAKSLLANGK